MNPNKIAEAIAKKEGCGCTYLNTVQVVEKFKGQTVWDGEVMVFDLTGHQAKKIYAWIDPDENLLVNVLELPPVNSPETAVRAYIVGTKRQPKMD